MIKRILWLGMLAAWFVAGQSHAQDSQCPHGSKPVRKVGNEVQCACDREAGFIFYNGRCQERPSVEDQLFIRATSIGQSIDATVRAINAEKNTRYLQLIYDQIPNLAGTAIALAITRDPKALVPEIAILSLEIEKIFVELKDCSGNESLRANCNNLKIFQGMLLETKAEIEKLKK